MVLGALRLLACSNRLFSGGHQVGADLVTAAEKAIAARK